MTNTINDNAAYPATLRGPQPDAHGQAAMLLAESLIFGLIERSVITVPDAIDIVDAAAEVKADIADDTGESPETIQRSLDLLHAIRDSLKLDAQGG